MKKRETTQAASTAVDLVALSEYVEKFATKRVVVLGDFVADAFQSGEITRVSREAPVLILRHRETHVVPGGGANAANNFASLGAKVLAVSAVGDDAAGDELIRLFREKRMDVTGIVRVKGWTTPTKTRFLAGWAHTVGQQVLRVDYEPKQEIPAAARKRLKAALESRVKKADALAISDYGFGIVHPEELRGMAAMRSGALRVTLDSRYRLTSFRGLKVSAATPNEAELEALHHTSIGTNVAELERRGEQTREEMKLGSLLVTRGKDGMAVFEPGKKPAHIPVHGSDQAVDVTGAGDTVLAAYTLALAAGATPIEAAHIANVAGGLVVMKRGTATVTREELLEAIHGSASETPA